MAFGPFVLAEAAFRTKATLTGSTTGLLESELRQIVVPDPLLGFRTTSSGVLTDHFRLDGKLIYTPTYTTDVNGLRNTPVPADATPNLTAAFFGCSFTFGAGCNDDETLPARFAAHAPNYEPLNFALSGYGPQHTWLQLQDPKVRDLLAGKSGETIFLYIDHHLFRLVGTPDVLGGWPGSMPWLSLEGDTVRHGGFFEDRDPLMRLKYQWLPRLHLFQFIRARFGAPPAPRVLDEPPRGAVPLFAKTMQDCASFLYEIAPDMRYRVLIFPGSRSESRVANALQRNGVNPLQIDYESLALPPDPELSYFRDMPGAELGHPRPLMYDAVAREMARALGALPATHAIEAVESSPPPIQEHDPGAAPTPPPPPPSPPHSTPELT